MPILKVENLSVSFGSQKVLDSLSFEVAEGESLAIIGPNGAGKTVLFRALLGTIPYGGKIFWQPNIRIGYVPQKIDIDRTLPLTLGDFLLSKIKIAKLHKSDVEKVLELVKLPKATLKTKLGNLSFGQFQRALIAFALLGKPDVLLFDEPTAGVDTPREEHIYEIVRRLQDERKLTVILISHELNLVYRYSTKVLCLNKEMLCEGTPQSELTSENLSKLYGESTIYHHGHK